MVILTPSTFLGNYILYSLGIFGYCGQAPDLQGADRMKAPKVLDAIADVVLRYRPKAKSKPAKKRARRKRKTDAARD
jgi:hypothetical protein